jgi:Ca-activated chloride channel family protein
MSFALPHVLWCLAIPLALFIWELTHARRTADRSQPKILRAEAGNDSLLLSASRTSAAVTSAPARLYLFAGLSFAVVALARPQWGRIDEPVFDQSREIVLAIDLSRSMLTPDVKPSRLARAKLLIQSLLERLAGERIGLVVFSGTAFLQSPLSADYEILREFLPSLGPDYLPEGGTNYTALIESAVSAFNHSSAADRFLIILSDGEATDDTWKPAAEALKKKNIRVISLAIGTVAGGMIPDGSGGFVKDDRGAVVMSHLEPNTLRQIAELTGGTYRDASTWVDLAALIRTTVESGQKGRFVEKNSVHLVERFQWPLAAALACLLLSFWREFPVRLRPRALVLGGPRAPAAAPVPAAAPARAAAVAAALLLFFLLAAGVTPSASAQNSAAAPASGEAEPPSPQTVALSKIVARLAAQEAHSARDWAELSLDTITWGRGLQADQQPVPRTPLEDALTAVQLGSKLDPKTADWGVLRAQLEDLLKKPEEQKPDQNDQQQQDKDKDKDPEKQEQNQQNKPEEGAQRNDAHENKNEKAVEGKQGQQAFGDMQDKAAPPPPPPTGETQKAGGTPEKKPDEAPIDPALALPLQKLDQLRGQDSPAKLFKLMQGDPQAAPAKKGKNW